MSACWSFALQVLKLEEGESHPLGFPCERGMVGSSHYLQRPRHLLAWFCLPSLVKSLLKSQRFPFLTWQELGWWQG